MAARRASPSPLGRDLSRRARHGCELCQQADGLRIFEVEPLHEEPDLERAALLCPRCIAALEQKRKPLDAVGLRFLEQAVWTDVVPAQLCAMRLTRRLASEGAGWAVDLLDTVYLSPEVQELLDPGSTAEE